MTNELSEFEKMLEFVDTDGKIRGWKKLPLFEKIRSKVANMVYLSVGVFYLIILFYAVTFLFPAIKTPELLLTVIIALIALILQFATTFTELTKPDTRDEIIAMVVEWNYDKLKSEPMAKDHLPLLRGLIKLKVNAIDFKLSEMHKRYPSVINEKSVVRNLYGLTAIDE